MIRAILHSCLLSLAIIGVLIGVSVQPAFAQHDTKIQRQAAQDYADSAFDLMQKGRYDAAAVLFRKADESFHSPMFLLFGAEAEQKRGQLVEARSLLQRILDEELADDAPQAFRNAKKEAKTRAEQLDARIPTVTITVTGADAADTTVMLDGRELTAEELGRPLQVNVGSHEASATVADGVGDRRRFDVAEGDERRIALTLPEADDVAAADSPSWLWPSVAYGVGAVGLVIGVGAGAAFLGELSDLESACAAHGSDPTVCPAERRDDADSVKTLGTVSTVGWVVAVLGVAAGTALLLVDMGDDDAGVSMSVLAVGPSGFALEGRF